MFGFGAKALQTCRNISEPNYKILFSVTGGITITTTSTPSFSPKFAGQVAKNQ